MRNREISIKLAEGELFIFKEEVNVAIQKNE